MNITQGQIDALQKLIKGGTEQAATSLSEMVGAPVHVDIPDVHIAGSDAAAAFGNEVFSTATVGFFGPCRGTGLLLLTPECASRLAAALTGEEPGSEAFDASKGEAIAEVGNLVINGIMGSIGNVLDWRVEFTVPKYLDVSPAEVLGAIQGGHAVEVLVGRTRLTIESLRLDGDIMLAFDASSFDALVASLASTAAVPRSNQIQNPIAV